MEKVLTKYRTIVLTVVFQQAFILFGLAQKQNNIWCFGNGAAIDFNGSGPVSIANSTMVSIEGCASVADPISGSLLFYSNGQSIWDASNTVMPNGTGLLGGPSTSSTQGVLIAPFPMAPSMYFVFTVDETNNNASNGFRYSIVDMRLNNGRGDVVGTQKNVLIQPNVTERLAIAPNGNGDGFWIMIHERNNNSFKAYALNANGVDPVPIISNVGRIHSSIIQLNGDETMGYLKFNHAFNKLAVAVYAANVIQLFDFDRCTGRVSNPISLSTIDNPYGIEFSPDDSKLYFSLYYNAGFTGHLYQANLTAPNIQNSIVLVGTSSSINSQCMGALQLGPDGKIYAVVNSESWLSAIDQPNKLGAACNFIDKAIILQQTGLTPSPGLLGLPQYVFSSDTATIPTISIIASNTCLSDSTLLQLKSSFTAEKIEWSFGDSTRITVFNNFQATHQYNDTGFFLVTAIATNSCGNDTFLRELRIEQCDSLTQNCRLIFPTAFSPNSDGSNDFFRPMGTCLPEEYVLDVNNRWGEKVFSTNSWYNQWDGTYKGQDCPIESYFYVVSYKFLGQSLCSQKGAVTLLR